MFPLPLFRPKPLLPSFRSRKVNASMMHDLLTSGRFGGKGITYATPALVQGPAKGTTAASPLNVAMVGNPTNGNIIVAIIGIRSVSDRTITGIVQVGVVWNFVQRLRYAAGLMSIEEWIGVVGAGAGTAISATISGSIYSSAIDVCEWSGLVAATDKLATATGQIITPTATGTTALTSQASQLWVGGVMSESNIQITPINGFTLLDGATIGGGYGSLSYLYKIVSVIGTANSGTTNVEGFAYYVGCMSTISAAPT